MFCNNAAGHLVWAGLSYLRIVHFLCPLSLLLPTSRDTQRVSLQEPSSSASPESLSWRPRSYGRPPLPDFLFLSHCVPLGMSHDCTQFWFLKAPTHFCHLDTLAKTSQFSRDGASWGQRQGLIHQRILALGMLEKQAPRGRCLMDAADMIDQRCLI